MAYIWSLHISLNVMKGLTLGTPCKKEYFLGGRPQETRAAGPPACRALSAARRVPGLSRCPLWWTWAVACLGGHRGAMLGRGRGCCAECLSSACTPAGQRFDLSSSPRSAAARGLPSTPEVRPGSPSAFERFAFLLAGPCDSFAPSARLSHI